MKEVKKPWGDFKQFTLNKKCTVKIHTVKPNQALSLQKHKKRKEIWYFLTEGYVQIGKEKRKIKKGEIVKIKKKQLHRLYSKNKTVQVLEISFGKFSEGDIVRLEDKYGRIKD
jgi:mannose-6-phosphate isomerase-like protein (cupin superfamily)